MEIEHDLPVEVREIEHLEIAMPDGVRLAARIWMPDYAETEPVPAILEYIPYRKNDKTLERDHARAPYMAARGYAYVRVDLRGTGESEGVMEDEYLPIELEDGCTVIAWLAEQSWCDGNVGIVGISWGGFNGLQIAALRPPALKAVVSICSTDDRYADDIHYMGGTMLVDQLSWASVMFGINSLPPDPTHVGERWRSMWMDRLKGSGLWLKTWLQHQTRDDFWKHGSICEDYDAVSIPIYAVSGWADGYCRTIFRLLENLNAPVKGLVGPWSHRYPHLGEPGPAIDWLNEELRWWDHWLKGADNGIMQEPRLQVFLQDHARPQAHYTQREGRWIAEETWPSRNVAPTPLALTAGGGLTWGSDRAADDGTTLAIASPLWVGLKGGKWCSYANPGDQPDDQRADDAGSLCFETAPLESDVEILGETVLTLTVSVDRPVALAAARLVDVAPDGAATRVSYGLLNLTHRDGHENPQELVPGEVYTVRLPFKHVAQTFRTGHRIRLGLSTNYFPLCWPAPEPVTLTLHPGRSPPVAAAPLPLEVDEPKAYEWFVTHDRSTDETQIAVLEHEGAHEIADHGLWLSGEGREIYRYAGADYRSVEGEILWTHNFRRDGWEVRTETRTRLTSTATHFLIDADLQAWEGEELVYEERWEEAIARRLV